MKIIKVIVDKLPSGCRDCDYMGYDMCILTAETITSADETKRPNHCPLTEENHDA